MLMVVARAFFGAQLTGINAGIQLDAQHFNVLRRTPDRQPCGNRAYVSAVEADADALSHIHRLCHAGIGTTGAEQGAEAGMAGGLRQIGVEVVTDIGVGLNHPVERHDGLLCS
jgi:hypothetical protein